MDAVSERHQWILSSQSVSNLCRVDSVTPLRSPTSSLPLAPADQPHLAASPTGPPPFPGLIYEGQTNKGGENTSQVSVGVKSGGRR